MATITGLNPAISWTVTGTPTTGTFVCGEPYVVDGGSGVELTAISPAATGTGATARNGSMINPTSASVHGWDGRAHNGRQASSEFTYDATWDYADSRNIALNLPHTLTSGKSLVSVKSYSGTPTRAKVIDDLAILTCIGSNPGSGNAFRPPFAGSTKPLWLKSQVDYGKLPMLTPPMNPTNGSGIGGTFNNFFKDDWKSMALGWFDFPAPPESWFGTETWRPVNQMNNYPGGPSGSSNSVAQMALYVMCDWGGAERTYANRLIQYGIDLYAALLLDPTRFCHGAGYGVGRMFPIMFAGYMLGDNDMLNVCTVVSGMTDYHFLTPINVFQELEQVWYSSNAIKDYRLPLPLSSYPDGSPIFGNYWPIAPSGSPSNNNKKDPAGKYDACAYNFGPYPYTDGGNVINLNGGDYVQSSSPPSLSAMLAIRILGLQSYLGPKGKAALNYYDRYANDPGMWSGFNDPMDYGGGPTGPKFTYAGFNPDKGADQNDYNYRRDLYGHGGTGNGFCAQMWDTYRYPGGRKLMGF